MNLLILDCEFFDFDLAVAGKLDSENKSSVIDLLASKSITEDLFSESSFPATAKSRSKNSQSKISKFTKASVKKQGSAHKRRSSKKVCPKIDTELPLADPSAEGG